ncbi:MAG: hypothetical protein ACRYFS_12005 [Janthinobacterium lividum]
MDWRTAYLEQAKSDYAMLLKLIREEAPQCHRLHYLQMTTEKMAKGFLTQPGGVRYPKTHDALVTFIKLSAKRPDIRRVSRFTNANQFAAYAASLLNIAQKVEDLSPEGGDHPNPEYPWEEKGMILLPTQFAFADLDFRSRQVIKLLEFIDDCFTLA